MIEDITSAQAVDEIATIDWALRPIRGFLARMYEAEPVLGVIGDQSIAIHRICAFCNASHLGSRPTKRGNIDV